eukprot:IDg14318t1
MQRENIQSDKTQRPAPHLAPLRKLSDADRVSTNRTERSIRRAQVIIKTHKV